MSTSRKPASWGPSKKINSWVRPGVCEVRASALRPVSALIRLDLPTLERPAKATSMPAIGGSVSIEGEAQKKRQAPEKTSVPVQTAFGPFQSASHRCRWSCEGFHWKPQMRASRHCERSEAIHKF